MADDTEQVGKRLPDFFEGLKTFWKYLSTPAGIGSTVPGVLAIADMGAGLLPFSAPVRPAIYFVLFGSILFAFYYECAQYALTTSESIEFQTMGRKAALHFTIGMALLVIYLPALGMIEQRAASSEETLFIWLWAASVVAVIGILEVTRSLVILGMKAFVARQRTAAPVRA